MKRFLALLLLLPAALFGAANDTKIEGIGSNGGRITTTLADPGADRVLYWDDTGNSVQWKDPAALKVDASGFSGNLTTSDDTLQEIANKLDALVTSGSGLANIVDDTTPQLGGTLDLNSQNINTGSATISPTEMSYLDGVTSAIQTQFSNKVSTTATNAATFSFVLDEDTMSSDSATKLPTQQSVKAYVDALAATAASSYASLSGSYDDPTWITGLDAAKLDLTNTPGLDVIDQAASASAIWDLLASSAQADDLTVTGTWTFGIIPSVTATDLTTETALSTKNKYNRDFDGTETTLTFSGSPSDGNVIYLVGDFSDTTLIHFPSSLRLVDQTTGTDLSVPTGVYTFVWTYDGNNTRWLLADTVPAVIRIATKVATGSYTIGTDDPGELYGGTIYVTSAATITIPAVASGAHFRVITIGATAVSVDPNASDLIYLDGTALDDGDKITNASTTGDIAEFYYYDATGWYAKTNGWSDGGP